MQITKCERGKLEKLDDIASNVALLILLIHTLFSLIFGLLVCDAGEVGDSEKITMFSGLLGVSWIGCMVTCPVAYWITYGIGILYYKKKKLKKLKGE